MTRSRLLRFPPSIALLAAGAALLGACSSDSAPAPQFDVLFISLDSVRADDLTFRNSQIAPHMAELAKRGTIFTQAVAGSTWTLPSHVQMFTGQPPSLHRVESDDTAIDPKTTTLPELLSTGGWYTAGFWTGWYLAGEYGFDRGFDTYRNAMTGGEELEQELSAALDGQSIEDSWQILSQRDKRNHEDVTSGNLATMVEELVANIEADDRLFLFAHFFDPHYDYVPPGDWATKLDPSYTGTIDGRNFWVNRRIYDPQRGRVISDRDLQHIRALYRGEVGWTDEAVGRILASLEEAGRLDETLVVITSDHGEEFFEHGNRGHRQSLYDEVLRVPLLVVPPKSLAKATPQQIDAQVELSDILPTILDYAGMSAPKSVAGRSLRPAVEGQAFASRPAVSSLMLMNSADDGTWSVALHEVLRMPEYKLWRRTLIDQNLQPGVDFLALCDLRADAAELNWMGPQDPANAQQTIRAWIQLEEVLAELREIYDRTSHADLSERTTTMAQMLESELKGLGYVDGDQSSGSDSPALQLPWRLGMRPPADMPR